jgi:hypothetical protein
MIILLLLSKKPPLNIYFNNVPGFTNIIHEDLFIYRNRISCYSSLFCPAMALSYEQNYFRVYIFDFILLNVYLCSKLIMFFVPWPESIYYVLRRLDIYLFMSSISKLHSILGQSIYYVQGE